MRRAGIAAALLTAAILVALPAAADPAPQRPGVTDVYFVGMAGWGSQDVFLSEARGAAAVVASAYRSPDRAILIANEPSRGLAVANEATLNAAVKASAAVMDLKEDVLFLLVTTHGSKKGAALERGGAIFGLLTPSAIRRALDRAKIRNAVIVVSACYSGIFRSIATADRLVITAARPDRPSFGCKDGNRWTYFGEAFFDQALRRDGDPVRAFASAREIVARRERADGFEPSGPQIAGGKRVAEKLRLAR